MRTEITEAALELGAEVSEYHFPSHCLLEPFFLSPYICYSNLVLIGGLDNNKAGIAFLLDI